MTEALRPGVRIPSPACAAEVIVIRAPGDPVELRWIATDGDGVLLGKRYVDAEETIEVLCTKPGPSSLAVGDAPLTVKDAKPLPSSD